jgi:antirestriction protein ArdC
MADKERYIRPERGHTNKREGAIYDGQADRENKVAAALTTLEQGIATLTDADSFKQYLTTMARFHQYSYGNVALILAQRPDATQVAGYRTWQTLGRQVKRGEKGLAILVPHKVKIESEEEGQDPIYIVRNFGIGYVFDISQTEGEELPQPPLPEQLRGQSTAGASLYGYLERYVTSQGITVLRRDTGTANGFYAPFRGEIAVHERLSGDQACKSLAHEVAHFTAEHNVHLPRADAETIAEASAYVVLSHYGIDTSSYSFPYIVAWGRDKAVLTRNLAGIQKTADAMISGVEQLYQQEQAVATAPVPPAAPPTDASLFPTGQEVQMPLFEAASG